MKKINSKCILIITLLCILLISTVSVCVANTETYTMVVFISGSEYWTYCYQGAKDAADLLGVDIKVNFQGGKEWSGAEEALVLDQLIGTNPNGFLVTAADAEALIPSIKRAMKEGIPVVCFDTDAPKSDRLAFVGTDNYQSGIMAGRAMGNLVKEGKIGITTVIGPDHLAKRLQGIKDVLKEEFPKVEIVSIVDDKSQPDISANVTASLIQANPDIKGILCTHGQGAPGIVAGVRQVGKEPGKDIFVSGWDFPKETLDLIEKGNVNFTVAQNPYAMGYWALLVCYSYNHPSTPWSPEVKTRKGKVIPSIVDTGVVIVSEDVVDEWR